MTSMHSDSSAAIDGIPADDTFAASEQSRARAGLIDGWRNSAACRYGFAVALVGAAHLIVMLSYGAIGPAITSIFLSAVIIASLFVGRGPALLATALAAADLDFTFTQPFHSFSFVFDDSVWLIVFVAVGLLTSSLQARRLRAEESLRIAQAELEQRVHERTAELIRSQEQLALLVNGVADQACFMLDRTGSIATWNSGAERFLGYSANHIIRCHVSNLCPVGINAQGSIGERVARHADARYEDQGWVRRKDDTRFWASIVLTPVHDEAGEPRGYAMLIRDITERRSLERDILEISERERQRIGHDLHDGLGQELSGIALLSTALASQLQSESSSGAAEADEIAELIHNSISHTRDLARGLCPVDLEDDGLVSALRLLAEQIKRLPGVECEFDASSPGTIDSVTASHLYRIAQEAINNAIRHGKAQHIIIRLASLNGQLILSITDDGVGLPEEPSTAGMGMRLMNYRAKMIRGTLSIHSAATRGTVVQCKIDRAGGVS